jgi:curved DNA-binding protein
VCSSFGSTRLSETEFVDYYGFLMVSPQADRAMVEWAVRLMLTRFGPKNAETADAEKYEFTKAAYRALVDPAKRAEYDGVWNQQKGDAAASPAGSPERRSSARNGQPPIEKIVVQLEATVDDVYLQIKIRQAVLSALYDVMITNPRQPDMGRSEIAKSVNCRIDDLEFGIWFLRERGVIKTSNSGLYAITSEGVEWVESGGVPHLTPKSAPQSVEPISSDALRAG